MTRSQVLVLDPPNVLRFTGPFNDVVTVQLRLLNPTDRRVCFKVKTNVPHQYCVHPSVALVEPLQQLSVDVMLQPSPSCRPDVDCTHKFLVQSVFAPEGDINSLERLWHQTKSDDIMITKLPCVFETPIIRQASITACNGSASMDSTEGLKQNSSAAENLTTTEVKSSDGLPVSLLIVLLVAVAAIFYKFIM